MAPPPWTGWSRSRSAVSPLPPRRRPVSGRHGPAVDEHRINIIDTPGTSISPSRWSVRCACSMARSSCSAGRRCAAADRDRLAAGQQVRSAAHGVRQQDGPRGRDFLRWSRSSRSAWVQPVPIQMPIGAEDDFAACRPGQEQGHHLERGDMGMTFELRAKSRPSWRRVRRDARVMVEAAAEANEELMEKYLEGASSPRKRSRPGMRARTLANEIVPVLCGSPSRTRVCRRCSTRSSTTCRRPPK
jgi:elongation factor G